MERIEHADYLYISHLHADHLDEPWLADHVDRDTTVLVPGYPTRELERPAHAPSASTTSSAPSTARSSHSVGGPDGSPSTSRLSITDGPGGDSALVVSDGTAGSSTRTTAAPTTSTRCAPTARSTCTGCSTAARSGTRWSTTSRRSGCASWSTPRSTASSPGRCATSRRSAPRAVVPSAGPPAFLDPELFRLNVDHRRRAEHLPRPAHASWPGSTPPGTAASWPSPARRSRSRPTRSRVTHPIARRRGRRRSSTTRRDYLRRYQADWMPWLDRACTRTWDRAEHRPAADAEGVVGAAAGDGARRCARRSATTCLLRAGDRRDPHRLPDRRGARLRRRALRVPLRHPARAASRRSSPSGPSTGATRCSCRAASGRGGRARSTSTSTTSSSRCRVSACAAPRPRRCASSTRTQRARGRGDRARRLHRRAALPASPGRPQRVRRDRGLRAGVHAARLALRPRDRPLPHRGRRPRCGSAGPPTPDRSARRRQWAPWTQTGMPIGIRLVSQMKSIATVVTRTQPCEAG